jgi:hypothetical protein
MTLRTTSAQEPVVGSAEYAQVMSISDRLWRSPPRRVSGRSNEVRADPPWRPAWSRGRVDRLGVEGSKDLSERLAHRTLDVRGRAPQCLAHGT